MVSWCFRVVVLDNHRESGREVYNLFMDFILFTIGALVGLGVTSFTIIPILIIIRFGIPNTKFLEKAKSLPKNNHIIRGYLFTSLFLGSVYCLLFWISGLLSQMLHSAYILGTVGTLVMGLGKTGANPQNQADYIETNKDKFV